MLLASAFAITSFAASNLHGDLNNVVEEIIPNANPVSQSISYARIAKTIQFWLFVFVGIIAVGYIIFIGARLLWAPGSVEEVTSALKSLAYVVVGLALMPFAYFLVNFIINIRL